LAKRLRREQTRNCRRLERCDKPGGWDLAQVEPQTLHPDVGHDPLLLEFLFRQVASRVLGDLAARDLELERSLQAEHEVEEVDRLGVEPVDPPARVTDFVYLA